MLQQREALLRNFRKIAAGALCATLSDNLKAKLLYQVPPPINSSEYSDETSAETQTSFSTRFL